MYFFNQNSMFLSISYKIKEGFKIDFISEVWNTRRKLKNTTS